MEMFFHVIVHKSALEILDKNLPPLKFYLRRNWRNEHVHLIATSKEQFKNFAVIRSEQIERSKLDYILNRYFFGSKEKHDFMCDVTVNISSLKNMCIKTILKNLNYLHNMQTLKLSDSFLPKKLLKDIFQQSKTHFHLPDFKGQNYVINYKSFTKQDIVFCKKFVVWFQTTPFQNINFLQYFNISQFFIVYYSFETADNDTVQMCLQCINFEKENEDFQRNYWPLFAKENEKFIQNPLNWCNVCQQVPLFQILTYEQFNYLYDVEFIQLLKYSLIGIEDQYLIKTDYFKKGNKVKSQNVLCLKNKSFIN